MKNEAIQDRVCMGRGVGIDAVQSLGSDCGGDGDGRTERKAMSEGIGEERKESKGLTPEAGARWRKEWRLRANMHVRQLACFVVWSPLN